jgi:4-carboxymuconolactone decarboxylase
LTRLADITLQELDDAQRRVHDAIVAGPRGKVEGPLKVWLNSPELADRAQALGAFCRFGSILPPRLSELAILITGSHWKAGFEWHVHAPIGIAAGLDPDDVELLRQGRAPQFSKHDESVVYTFVIELLVNRRISDPAFARAHTTLGTRGVVDLVGILGYYSLISMTIVAFDVPVPDGSDPFHD